ncbi:MAG: rod shape-determining protein MreC [Arenicella sp.]
MLSDRSAASGKSLIIACSIIVVLLAVDSRTQLLKPARAVLGYVLYPVSYLASIPSQFFGGVDSFLENEPEIENAYEHLRTEYVKLKADMLRRTAVERENAKLRALLGVAERSGVGMQIAKSVEIDLDPYQHRVLVNKGAANGIYVGQAVLDDNGVIGQVSEVFRASSVITLITDPSHAIPVRIQRSGRHILAEGSGDLSSLRIPFLNKNVDIRQGDILETSGLGGRFPAGYPVAKVNDIDQLAGEAFLSIDASPLAAVESLDYLLFMSSIPKQKQTSLVQGLGDSNEGFQQPEQTEVQAE